jgi:hypothetical protein
VILRNPTKSQKFFRILGSEIFQDKKKSRITNLKNPRKKWIFKNPWITNWKILLKIPTI